MLVNGLINGILVPVEVTEEELVNNGFIKIDTAHDDELREEGNRTLKEHFFDYLVDMMELEYEQCDRLSDNKEWYKFRDAVTDLEDSTFIEQVVNGVLLKIMKENAEELLPKEKYFEVEVEVSRVVTQFQTVTIAIKAEDEADARSYMYNLDYSDVENYVDGYGWDNYNENVDDYEINDWYVNGETNIDETGYPVINE